MAIPLGTKLGPYEILSAIGAGGMGEVYKAKDTRLERIVAIKVLPAHLSERLDLRERFEREAKAVSSLNHPHICVLHDVGRQDNVDFIVMEYLEGQTLAARLLKGPLPPDEALKYAMQMADALDKAHRQGVVHRDLKPSNIMITKSGVGVKLLDFGLAKLRQPDGGAFSGESALPTQGSNLTIQGTVLGTLQYMSPEQLEGKDADARTDIFAFGGVFYEMLTAKKAFEGKSQVSLMGAILKDEPAPISVDEIRAAPALNRIIRTCVAKDPDRRWQTAWDLLLQLQWAAEGAAAPVEVSRAKRKTAWLAWPLAAAGIAAAAILGVLYVRVPAPDRPHARFAVLPPKDAVFLPSFGFQAISPDGRHLAFLVSSGGAGIQLWLRPIGALEAQPLAGTEQAGFPFWSADSRSILFFSGGKLKKVEAAGGPIQSIANVTTPNGATWNRDGTIVFSPSATGPLLKVSANGGEAAAATLLDQSRKEVSHRWPHFLPDGRHFLYLAQAPNTIYVGSLDGAAGKRLLNADTAALYAQGHLLFIRQNSLMAQAFDTDKLEVSGDPFVVAEQVDNGINAGVGTFSVSDTGILTYRSGGSSRTQLSWFDRAGKALGTVGAVADYQGLDLSPDGERIVVHRHEGQGGNLWMIEWMRDIVTRFTFDPVHDVSPIWSRDGSKVAFASNRAGPNDIYQKVSSGAGSDEELLKSEIQKRPTDWSSDGKFIVYEEGPLPRDLWVLPLSGDKKPVPFLKTPFDEARGQLSPDGRWMAYTSNESGNHQIYVQPYPASGGKWQISNNGGSHPRWRSNGKELFYLTSDGTLMSVDVNLKESAIDRGVPKPLFRIRLTAAANQAGLWHPYSVSADGQRFLAISNIEDPIAAPLTVVLNWLEAAKR